MTAASGDEVGRESGRGRRAERPGEISRAGILDVAFRVRDQLRDDNASLLAAGVGLFAMLAAFPAIAAIVSIYGLFASASQVAAQLESLRGVIPADALDILTEQLGSLAADQQRTTVSFGVAASIAVALWSARKGMAALMRASNTVYGEHEERSFVKQVAISLAFTFGAIIYFIITAMIGAAVPIIVESLFANELIANTLSLLRWPLLWLFVVLGLAVVYRFAPSRTRPKWRWVSWGSAIAATLWVIGGVLFELYVRNFGSYNETYGTLGGVVVLLLWLYLSGFIVILGAEINAELEHQTERDTTIGPEAPMGERGAYVADTLGEARR